MGLVAAAGALTHTVQNRLYGNVSQSIVISLTVVGEEVSSSSSSAASSSASVTPAPVGDDTEHGGARRSVWTILENLQSADLPGIVRERKLPSGEYHQAALTHYEDVPPGSWYEAAVADFLKRGVLDATQLMFRPEDPAVRAEFAKVLVKLRNIQHPVVPAVPSFDDTDPTAWYHAFVEEAALHGWMKGYNNCYGTRPCMLRPGAPATRAEAVAMIVRYYRLEASNRAPVFSDVPDGAWYTAELQAAADHCIVQGDEQTGLVAPERLVNRAEMVMLFARAEQNLVYGQDCGGTHQSAGASYIEISRSILIAPFEALYFFFGYPMQRFLLLR